MSAMANRTVLVDNNTWNNTHIATVGTLQNMPIEAWNSALMLYSRMILVRQPASLKLCRSYSFLFYFTIFLRIRPFAVFQHTTP